MERETPRRTDVSRQALSIARVLDRVLRTPGRYAMIIDVPAHRRGAWDFEVSRMDVMRRDRTKKAGG